MKVALSAFIGGVLGFLVGYFGRCATGTCPLTGNPYVSTAVGAILGALIGAGF
ncbi:MAG: DUF6132 family protein [Candidatus Aureabacteria bacterium]|nr:DUF6132 family protein [Candidatus Auribacterota bacterium]